jgi:hypothetical protein
MPEAVHSLLSSFVSFRVTRVEACAGCCRLRRLTPALSSSSVPRALDFLDSELVELIVDECFIKRTILFRAWLALA